MQPITVNDIVMLLFLARKTMGATAPTQRGYYSPLTSQPQRPSREVSPPSWGGRGANDLYFISEAFSLHDPVNFARFREIAIDLSPSLIIVDTAAEALDIKDWTN